MMKDASHACRSPRCSPGVSVFLFLSPTHDDVSKSAHPLYLLGITSEKGLDMLTCYWILEMEWWKYQEFFNRMTLPNFDFSVIKRKVSESDTTRSWFTLKKVCFGCWVHRSGKVNVNTMFVPHLLWTVFKCSSCPGIEHRENVSENSHPIGTNIHSLREVLCQGRFFNQLMHFSFIDASFWSGTLFILLVLLQLCKKVRYQKLEHTIQKVFALASPIPPNVVSTEFLILDSYNE